MRRVSKSELERHADSAGLWVTTWAPGDGVRRYRLHSKLPNGNPGRTHVARPDYHDGTHLTTQLGVTQAMEWVRAWRAGRDAERALVAAAEQAQGRAEGKYQPPSRWGGR